MNSSVYIFGSLSSGYTQYPDDNKKVLFKTTANKIYSNNTIAVKRDGNLLYYIYAHAISSQQLNPQYIGLAIELNGLYYSDISFLFQLFEDTFTKIVISGKFVKFNDNGDIIANIEHFHHEQNEVNWIIESLSSSIVNLPESGFRRLPPINYSAGLNEQTHLSDKATIDDIDNALLQFNTINIYRDNKRSLLALSGYSEKIKRLSSQIQTLSNANIKLSNDLTKTQRQKRRTTIVLILSTVIAVAIVVIISVSTNLSEQVQSLRHDLSVLQDKLKEQKDVIWAREQTIMMNNAEINSLKANISDVGKELNDSKSENENLTYQVNYFKQQVEALTTRNKELEIQVKRARSQTSSSNSAYSSGRNSFNRPKTYISAGSITLSIGYTKFLHAEDIGPSIEWESDNNRVATVTPAGVVKGISAGTTYIWAKGKEYKRWIVTVPGGIFLRVGQTMQLGNGTSETHKWESDNTNVVTVTSTGLVKAVGKGRTNVWGYFDGWPKRHDIHVD